MSVVIKVTDMSDNSVKFYNDMIEFMKEFYSEEDYNDDCENYQDRDSRENILMNFSIRKEWKSLIRFGVHIVVPSKHGGRLFKRKIFV